LQLRLGEKLNRAIELRAQPLVRIHRDAVGPFDPIPHRSELGADHRRSGPRGIDVHVKILVASDCDDFARPITGADRCTSDREHDARRLETGCTIRLDSTAQRYGVHGTRLVGRHLHQVLLTDPGDADRFIDRRVRLGGRVNS